MNKKNPLKLKDKTPNVYTCWYVGCKKEATVLMCGGDTDPRSGHWCAKHYKERVAEHERYLKYAEGGKR